MVKLAMTPSRRESQRGNCVGQRFGWYLTRDGQLAPLLIPPTSLYNLAPTTLTSDESAMFQMNQTPGSLMLGGLSAPNSITIEGASAFDNPFNPPPSLPSLRLSISPSSCMIYPGIDYRSAIRVETSPDLKSSDYYFFIDYQFGFLGSYLNGTTLECARLRVASFIVSIK